MKNYYIKLTAALMIILVSVFFCVKLAYPGKTASGNSKEVKALINTLYNGNVHISPELIDTDIYSVCVTEMTNGLDAPALARQFLGRGVRHDGDIRFVSEDGDFTVNGTHFKYTPTEPKFSADTKSVSLTNATKIANMICEEYGIDYKDGRTELSGGRSGISVAVMKSFNGLPVFNNTLVMELHPDGLHSITGVDYIVSNSAKEERNAKSISDALTEFMDTCTDKNRETIITDVRLGYLLENTDDTKTTAKPVWRIIVENSAVYYINA